MEASHILEMISADCGKIVTTMRQTEFVVRCYDLNRFSCNTADISFVHGTDFRRY